VLQQQDRLRIRNRIEPYFISLTSNPACRPAGRCERLNFEPPKKLNVEKSMGMSFLHHALYNSGPQRAASNRVHEQLVIVF
jgi:hypothetical protein